MGLGIEFEREVHRLTAVESVDLLHIICGVAGMPHMLKFTVLDEQNIVRTSLGT